MKISIIAVGQRQPPWADAAVAELTGALLARSAAVTRLAKRATAAGEEMPFSRALDEAEGIYLRELVRTADMHEGIAAFLEKRPPDWKHE